MEWGSELRSRPPKRSVRLDESVQRGDVRAGPVDVVKAPAHLVHVERLWRQVAPKRRWNVTSEKDAASCLSLRSSPLYSGSAEHLAGDAGQSEAAVLHCAIPPPTLSPVHTRVKIVPPPTPIRTITTRFCLFVSFRTNARRRRTS